MIEKRKAEAMAVKQRRARRGISLFNKKKDKSDLGDNKDLDQANNKYSLQL